MSRHTYQLPQGNSDLPRSLLLGTGVAIALFVVMALAQMIGEVVAPNKDVDEVVMAFTPPEIVELEDEPPPLEEEEEPPPELEEAPPQLSLDQLDIALNPGTGGSLMGDFAMPVIAANASALGTEDFVDFSDLDQIPRPIGVTGFNFPRRLLRKKASGRIILMIKLSEKGEVLEAEIDSSDLPAFDDFVVSEVRSWKFTPPTQQGRPVRAQARLPIPINVK